MKVVLMKPALLSLISAALLASCGSGGTGTSAPQLPHAATQAVSGTLTIGNPGSTTTSTGRRPLFVSPSTKHAALFIDGAAAASGSTTTCTGTTGTGTGCTIAWTAQLAVPAAHVFAVETDTGTNAPANTVLSEGAGTYAVVAGAGNTLGALSLNGIASGATFAVTSCSGANPNSLCNGTVTISAPAGNAIAYTGTTPVPTAGNSPSSGNVFDNGNVTLVSSAPAVGTITGTAQPTFSALAAGTLTVSGVDTTGISTYQVTCASGATGTFGITLGGGATPSGAVTAAELAGLSPAVSFPAAGVAVVGTAPSFTCNAGTISSASGTLPVN
jgi:hypothetical protein